MSHNDLVAIVEAVNAVNQQPAAKKNRAKKENQTMKLSHYEFTRQAIMKLRKPPFSGIHVVYSGFNQAFRAYFGENPVGIVDKLPGIVVKPTKGGAIIRLAEDAAMEQAKKQAKQQDNVAKVLSQIIG